MVKAIKCSEDGIKLGWLIMMEWKIKLISLEWKLNWHYSLLWKLFSWLTALKRWTQNWSGLVWAHNSRLSITIIFFCSHTLSIQFPWLVVIWSFLKMLVILELKETYSEESFISWNHSRGGRRGGRKWASLHSIYVISSHSFKSMLDLGGVRRESGRLIWPKYIGCIMEFWKN